MLVLGFVLLAIFGISQRYTPKPFIPYHLLTTRTIIGTCLLCLTYQVAYYCYASYFSSFLQVVLNLSIAEAGYVTGIFGQYSSSTLIQTADSILLTDIISGCYLILLGLLIRKTGRFRVWLYFAVPVFLVGLGLMYQFRYAGAKLGWIIFSQILLAFSGSTIILCRSSCGRHLTSMN